MVTDSDALIATLEEWLADSEKLREHGRRALDYFGEHRGAAGRTADLLVESLSEQE